MKKGLLVPEASIELIVAALVLVGGILWFSVKFASVAVAKENSQELLEKMITMVQSAKEDEIRIMNLEFGGNFLYGFNAGTEPMNTENGLIKKPDESACNAGGCLCLCSEKNCDKKEERTCYGVIGITKFASLSNFKGSNKGTGANEVYSLAIDGKALKISCISFKKSKSTMFLSDSCSLE